MPQTVEALLFDLGGVIIALDQARAHARWAEFAGVAPDQIAARIAARVAGGEAFCRHERGEISDAAFFAHLREELKIELSDAELLEGWNAIFLGEMPGIRPLLASVHGQVPLYIFSNTNLAHQMHWAGAFCDLLAPFRKIYVSHELGARKPEPAAFRAVLADMGVVPERVLFFDDKAENVEGARACGLGAVEVASASDIAQALRRVALGPAATSR